MYNLRIRTLARQDIQDTINYYDKINPKITDRLLNELFAEFKLIKTNPYIYSEKYKTTRVAYLKKFPFGIHFIVTDKNIDILAVLHTGRNPLTWTKR